jgi:hypothetical protein
MNFISCKIFMNERRNTDCFGSWSDRNALDYLIKVLKSSKCLLAHSSAGHVKQSVFEKITQNTISSQKSMISRNTEQVGLPVVEE